MKDMTFNMFNPGPSLGSSGGDMLSRWTMEQANEWYARQPWLLGCNYVPHCAINQLEMWQADTFDPQTIDQELGWARQIGFNTLRVFLHDQLWVQDAYGLKQRIDQFLGICARHDIRPMLVLFDSCWHPYPQPGRQPDPRPGVHNSGWVQGPGAEILGDESRHGYLEDYVKGIVSHFRADERILCWDVWNEPDNTNDGSYRDLEPANKVQIVLQLLPQVFAWVRSASPVQPVSSGIWIGDWSTHEGLRPIERIQIEFSDIITFHNYDGAREFERRVRFLQRYGRPLLCTEYMARGNKSTFQGAVRVALKYNVGMFNWGLVAGKSNTYYPWDSWQQPYLEQPPVWFHDIFHPNGEPYRKDEVDFLRRLMLRKQVEAAKRKEQFV